MSQEQISLLNVKTKIRILVSKLRCVILQNLEMRSSFPKNDRAMIFIKVLESYSENWQIL